MWCQIISLDLVQHLKNEAQVKKAREGVYTCGEGSNYFRNDLSETQPSCVTGHESCRSEELAAGRWVRLVVLELVSWLRYRMSQGAAGPEQRERPG